ncbi:hypothetical protein R1flu_011382 [Riccia fluitans]|uniref:EF-hand domain-containing protein n=1 Tax=Riccia fluitans TaxID=41844 RepID=A0ABD1Z7U8_9MARC
MRIPTVVQVLLPNCGIPKRGKPKAPAKDHNPFAEILAVDLFRPMNSKSCSPRSHSPSTSSPWDPEISSLSSAGSNFSSSDSSNSSSDNSSLRSSSRSNSPRPATPVSSPPWIRHSRMTPGTRLPAPMNSNSSPASASLKLQSRSPKRPLVDQLLEMENERLAEAFRIIDSNGDGKISEEELGAMWRRLGEKLSQKELRLMIREADMNGDGVLDLQDFVAFFKSMMVHPEIDDPIQHADDIRLAFDLSAFAHDGLISAAELETAMKKVTRKKVSAADCAAMVRYLDSDGDGLVNFNEFQKLMTSSIFAGRTELF